VQAFRGDQAASDVCGESDARFQPPVSARGFVMTMQPRGRIRHAALEGEEEGRFPCRVALHIIGARPGRTLVRVAKRQQRTWDVVAESAGDSGMQECGRKTRSDHCGLMND
jgi:hypothetical protein